MIIKKAILHILDFNSNVSVFSQQTLDFSDSTATSYIEKHLEKIHKDSSKKSGKFLAESHFAENLVQYGRNEIEFIDFSSWIANLLYEQISHSDKLDSTDLLVVDYINDDVTYFAVMLLTNKSAYTHQVMNDDNGLHNEIIKHFAILPNPSQKIDSFAIVNCDDLSVEFLDKKKSIDGIDVNIIPEILLECTSEISTKEAVKIVKEVTNEIAEEYGSNSVVAVSKAKSYIVETTENSESFSPVELGKQVFADSPAMQDAFEKKIEEREMPKDIKVEHKTVVKTAKSHKIKTDTGIELTFPAEYFENPDYIEFINNPNGTLSIELKNIGKIVNK